MPHSLERAALLTVQTFFLGDVLKAGKQKNFLSLNQGDDVQQWKPHWNMMRISIYSF